VVVEEAVVVTQHLAQTAVLAALALSLSKYLTT
jgi:hypothetical protein